MKMPTKPGIVAMKDGVISDMVTVHRYDAKNSGAMQRKQPITQLPGIAEVDMGGVVHQMPFRQAGDNTATIEPPATRQGGDPNARPRATSGQSQMPAKDRHAPK